MLRVESLHNVDNDIQKLTKSVTTFLVREKKFSYFKKK